jgi:glycosyltransferase involved in cell wall biosynthesis
MRVGQNPAKSIDYVRQPEKFTIAVVSYIPYIGGYYAQGLDLLKVCLGSLQENTVLPFDLLVFDNASCSEVRDFLLDAKKVGWIQYLVLSDENIGKAGAWNFIFGAAQGEFVAYADSDVYFYPGWLTELYRVMKVFPKAGMVTGMPLLNPEEYSTSTVKWVDQHQEAHLERGQVLTWDDYWRHAGTLGSDREVARRFYDQHESLLLNYKEHKYYVGAGHFQFLARKSVLQKVIPLPSDRPMGQVRELDIAINDLGYLRLCTTEWWVEHIGNTLQGWQPIHEVQRLEFGNQSDRQMKQGILKWKPIRRVMTKLHNITFDYLYR